MALAFGSKGSDERAKWSIATKTGNILVPTNFKVKKLLTSATKGLTLNIFNLPYKRDERTDNIYRVVDI